jgi:single-strand DNA-binding protein
MLTVEGYFKPEEWSDQEGVKHQRVLLVATKFYETPDKEEETPAEEKKTSKKKAK